ncbi:hypothetical protein JB92DRAFT_3148510 [Gautieria morchelliformis]|nr:hypothetical protein JB92DRAFT_3148510 [Gautieria morchelliformis]
MGCLVRIVAVILAGSRLAVQVAAQAVTTAICTTATWTFNQEDVSPCLVASSLQAACQGGTFTVPALPPGLEYTGPLAGFSDPCKCSTVTYTLVAACATCQNGNIDTWTDWKTNCTASDISLSSFPLTIPLGTTVPSWAYLNISTTGIWDATAANINHNNGAPDSSATGPTATASNSFPTNGHSSSGGSKTPVGAIAGGVAGGVVGLILIGGLVFFLVRRNKRSRTGVPSTQYRPGGLQTNEKFDSPLYPQPSVPPPTPYYVNRNQAPGVAPLQSVPQVQEEAQKLYNPADPSTFPSLDPSSASGYTSPSSPGVPQSVRTTSYSGQPPPTSYDTAPYGSQAPSTPSGAATFSEPASPTRPFSQQVFGGGGYASVPAAPPQQFQAPQQSSRGYNGMAEV